MPKVNIDWDNLGFSYIPTKTMYMTMKEGDKPWEEGKLIPFGEFKINPCAGVLNYGQGVFEGMKAQRTKKNEILLFRTLDNGKRMEEGCIRMSMPPFDPEKFVYWIKKVVAANEEYIPPYGKGSLYIRPILFGSGPVLGVAPAPSYTFIIFVVPVGPYFKEGFKPIKLEITKKYHRAATKGTGNVKTVCNYAGTILPAIETHERGFDQLIYLDATHELYIEEVGTANFFCVLNGELVTPKLGSILPGMTRASVMKLAEEKLEMNVIERDIAYEEVFDASEVFCTGTAAVVTPIGSITFEDEEHVINDFQVGKVTQDLYDLLTGIQLGELPDPYSWVLKVK